MTPDGSPGQDTEWASSTDTFDTDSNTLAACIEGKLEPTTEIVSRYITDEMTGRSYLERITADPNTALSDVYYQHGNPSAENPGTIRYSFADEDGNGILYKDPLVSGPGTPVFKAISNRRVVVEVAGEEMTLANFPHNGEENPYPFDEVKLGRNIVNGERYKGEELGLPDGCSVVVDDVVLEGPTNSPTAHLFTYDEQNNHVGTLECGAGTLSTGQFFGNEEISIHVHRVEYGSSLQEQKVALSVYSDILKFRSGEKHPEVNATVSIEYGSVPSLDSPSIEVATLEAIEVWAPLSCGE